MKPFTPPIESQSSFFVDFSRPRAFSQLEIDGR